MEAVNILAADRIVAISAHEARLITERHRMRECSPSRTSIARRIMFRGFAQRDGSLFIGHYLHAPNQDAAEHLARDNTSARAGRPWPTPRYFLWAARPPN